METESKITATILPCHDFHNIFLEAASKLVQKSVYPALASCTDKTKPWFLLFMLTNQSMLKHNQPMQSMKLSQQHSWYQYSWMGRFFLWYHFQVTTICGHVFHYHLPPSMTAGPCFWKRLASHSSDTLEQGEWDPFHDQEVHQLQLCSKASR